MNTMRVLGISRFFGIFLVLGMVFMPTCIHAYDGDMDEYHEFKEDLNLVRDSYLNALNISLGESEDAGSTVPQKIPSWSEMEFEVPSLAYLTVKEIPQGYELSGSHGAYKVVAKVKVRFKEDDFVYDLEFAKGTNAAGKDILREVFGRSEE